MGTTALDTWKEPTHEIQIKPRFCLYIWPIECLHRYENNGFGFFPFLTYFCCCTLSEWIIVCSLALVVSFFLGGATFEGSLGLSGCSIRNQFRITQVNKPERFGYFQADQKDLYLNKLETEQPSKEPKMKAN